MLEELIVADPPALMEQIPNPIYCTLTALKRYADTSKDWNFQVVNRRQFGYG